MTRLDDSYVTGLFDGYSQTFEQSLVEQLDYVGHELVADALMDQEDWLQTSHDNSLTLLDLGCGTGLLGERLHRRLSELGRLQFDILGVDLSTRMVEVSRKRTLPDDTSTLVYRDVQIADGVSYLKTQETQSAHAITASDVFIYVGALEELFAEASRVLTLSGRLAFAVELSDQRQGFQLLKSGRFGLVEVPDYYELAEETIAPTLLQYYENEKHYHDYLSFHNEDYYPKLPSFFFRCYESEEPRALQSLTSSSCDAVLAARRWPPNPNAEPLSIRTRRSASTAPSAAFDYFATRKRMAQSQIL